MLTTSKAAPPPRRRRIVITVALVAGTWAACAAPAVAQATFEKIKARGQISIGYRDDAAPFSYLDDQKKVIGYSIDVCAAVVAQLADRLELKTLRVNLVSIPIDQVMAVVREGSVDLLCTGTSDTPERRAQVAFSKPIYLDGVGVMVRNKDGIRTVNQLNGKQVAVIKTSTASSALEAYRARESLTWKTEAALNSDAALSQLQLGWVQGYARDKVLLAMQLASLSNADQYALLPERLSTEAIAIAFRKDDLQLQTLVNSVITEAAASGKAQAWHDKWFVNPIPLYKQRKALGIPMSPELKAALDGAK